MISLGAVFFFRRILFRPFDFTGMAYIPTVYHRHQQQQQHHHHHFYLLKDTKLDFHMPVHEQDRQVCRAL